MQRKNNKKTVLYFGFGANSQREMIRAITGSAPRHGERAFLRGYKLVVQELTDVPSKGKVSPQFILRKSWGEKFQSYQIAPGTSRERVYGTLWEMSEKSWLAIQRWELVPEGWTKEVKVLAVVGSEEHSAHTEVLRGKQTYRKVVKTKNYKPFVVDKKTILKKAREAR